MPENILEKNTVEQYKHDMTVYSIETNRKRSIPDAKDGLKTVQRRILDVLGNDFPGDKTFLKTSKVTGGVIGKSHPHGDTSVEDAIKPLTNWFECKIPLLYSESNMGSMQGDGAAAGRYTEIMLSTFALEAIFKDLKEAKEVVDWVPTFDNKDIEPEYFPVAVPLLLINGAFGIGTGMMTEVPKHNLGEVIDATINLIKNPNAPVVLIPDHAMPCQIIDTNWKSICNKGNGKYIVRAIIDIEHIGNHDALILKSVPDRVFFDKGNSQNGGVKYKILSMIESGKLPQIDKIDEDSHGNDMRIVFHLKPGSDPNYVREVLYKETQLQDTYLVNFEFLDGIKLIRMSYKSYLEFFIEQRKTTKFRLYCIKLQKIRTEMHQLDAYIKTIESGKIDQIIQLIKNKDTTDDTELIEFLIKNANLTDVQAKYIINSNLKQLSKAYLKRYKEKVKEDQEADKIYMEKINNDQLILQDIIDELLYFKKKFNTPRRCSVIKPEDINAIPKGTFKIVITENNYLKKLSIDDHVGAYKGDNPKHILIAENTENILLFSAQGKVFKLPVHKIPLTERSSVGTDIRMIIKGLISDIIKVEYEPTLKELSKSLTPHFITVVTANNCIKKLSLNDFVTVPPSGIIYTKLNPGDIVKDVLITPNTFDIILYSDKKALRVNMANIPNYKRSALGVTAMKLSNGDIIDGVSVIYPDATDVVVVTESGRINKFNIGALPISDRNKAGSKVISLGKGDRIHSIFGVNDSNILKVVTSTGVEEIPINSIKAGSSISKGDRCIPAKDIIIKCSIFKSK